MNPPVDTAIPDAATGTLWQHANHAGPLTALSILLMLLCIGLAVFKKGTPVSRSIWVVFPLLISNILAIPLASRVVPYLVVCLTGGTDLDLDAVILGFMGEMRVLFFCGLTASGVVVIALLIRHFLPQRTT